MSYHTLANQYTFLGEHDDALKWRKKAVEAANDFEKDGFYYYLSTTQLLFDFDAALESAKKGALIEIKTNAEIGDDSHAPLQKYVEQLHKYRDRIDNEPVFAIKEIVSDYYIPFYQIKVDFIHKHFNNKMIAAEEKETLLGLIKKDSYSY